MHTSTVTIVLVTWKCQNFVLVDFQQWFFKDIAACVLLCNFCADAGPNSVCSWKVKVGLVDTGTSTVCFNRYSQLVGDMYTFLHQQALDKHYRLFATYHKRSLL